MNPNLQRIRIKLADGCLINEMNRACPLKNPYRRKVDREVFINL
jgi:hypothetical protein